MSDTPRTDANADIEEHGPFAPAREMVHADLARQLERELNAAKAALSGRTVSCSNCNALAAENAKMRATMQIIYDAADGCADGAPDGSDHDKLCLELTHTLRPFIK